VFLNVFWFNDGLKSPDVIVNILRSSRGHKMPDYVIFKNR